MLERTGPVSVTGTGRGADAVARDTAAAWGALKKSQK